MLCKIKCRIFIAQYSKPTTIIHATGQTSDSAEQVFSEKGVMNTGSE